MKERQDAWQEQDDLILAETVLDYIRNRSTQLAAFEEAGEKLNRTSAACGFRWNAEVRKRYAAEISKAKSQRMESKRAYKINNDNGLMVKESTAAMSHEEEESNDYIEQIILAARGLKQQHANVVTQLEKLTEELQRAREEIESLKNKLSKDNPETVASEDYQALIKILGRARNLGVLEKLNR